MSGIVSNVWRALATSILCTLTVPAFAQDKVGADPALVERGNYLATAGDCAACHGETGKGGLGIQSPMGSIFASNITPEPVNGIGNWSLQQFADALRKGRAPEKDWLYPAMPYTSYTGLSNDDVKALYSYFQLGVKPDANKVPATKLPFPFMRIAMIGWNLLNLSEGHAAGAVPVEGDQLKRGQLLIETFGHCSTCHTPRNDLMGEIDSKHLGGGQVGTWFAPNITPSSAGIGDWSDSDLKTFLKTGIANDHVAAGDMGLAVEHSFSHLSDTDLDAMIAYLRKVQAISGPVTRAEVGAAKGIDTAAAEARPEGQTTGPQYQAINDGAELYLGACASCHGPEGAGSDDGKHPSLVKNGTVRMFDPSNLIAVVSDGIEIHTPQMAALMPGFKDQMTSTQVASLATYVRSAFGNVSDPKVMPDQIEKVWSGQSTAPWLIRNAQSLAIIGLIVSAVIVLAIFTFLLSRRRRHRPAST